MDNIRNVLIVRYGEVALKGMNKPYFEKTLIRRIRAVMGSAVGNSAEDVRTEANGGLILVRGYPQESEEALARSILKVFGVSTVSLAWELASREMEDIRDAATEWARKATSDPNGAGTPNASNQRPIRFKVFAKRADKTYPLTSPEMSADIGEAVLNALGDSVRVDVHHPELRLYVHLRLRHVLLYDDRLKGFGGLPLGTNGRGLVLLSGGIDSPVAAWMMAKRGMLVDAVHFHSYPYTSKRAEEKVCDLADILASYCGRVRIHIVNLLAAQEALAAQCPESEMTILTRRFMMRVAEQIARRETCGFLITGENLGQVASQTAEALAVTDAASGMPVLRPLIAMDKVDIIDKAREIGTYETSILPYEDCCTVFLPKHPSTRPTLRAILDSEARLGEETIAALISDVLSTETLYAAEPEP
jgi:thiamine biosynthesis protein ThiI